jgi:hypothetical protein
VGIPKGVEVVGTLRRNKSWADDFGDDDDDDNDDDDKVEALANDKMGTFDR